MIETGGVKEWSDADWNYENDNKRRGDPYRDEREEESKKVAKQVLASRSRVIGDKLKIVFWIYIVNIVFAILALGYATLVATNFKPALQFLDMLNWGAAIGGLLSALVYFIVIASLKPYHGGFFWAGLLYFVVEIFDFIKAVGFASDLNALLSLVVAIANIFQIRCLVAAAASSLTEVDLGLSYDWDTFWKKFLKVLLGILAATLLLFIPVINLAAVLVLLVLTLVMLIMSFWLISLIWKTASTLQFSASMSNM